MSRCSHVRLGARARSFFSGLALACATLMAPAAVHGQAVTGTILGTVTDNTGAVMPGVTVTVTQVETGRTREFITDGNGEYTAPSIPTGTYTIKAELAGFKAVTLTDIRLSVDQRARIDVKLEVGDLTESVNIVASTPLVQSSSSDLSTTIQDEQIKALPLNGRNFVSLTRTIPGVMRGIPGSNIDGAGSLAWRASAAFSANGQRPRDNNYMLDGVDNNETWLQTVGDLPEPRRHRRVQAADQHLLGRVRQVARRRRQPADQVRRQPVPRQRIRVPAQRRLRRQQLLQQPRGPAEAGLPARSSSAARSAGPRARPDVLLRRLPGSAHRTPARRTSPRCPPCACATATSARSTA